MREPVPGTGLGLKEADIPVGRPLTENETSPFDPLRRLMSTGTSTEVPVRTSTTVWPGFSVKSAGWGPSGVVTETSSMARYLPSGPSGPSAITSKYAICWPAGAVAVICWVSGAPRETVT